MVAAELEAEREEQRRLAIARANGVKPHSFVGSGIGPGASTRLSQPTKPGRFSLKSFISCSCFSATAPEAEQDARPPPARYQ